MIEYVEALDRLLGAVEPLERQEVELEAALGRVLAGTIVADRDFPPTDRSAMDGFAVRAADLAGGCVELRVAGEVRAGRSADRIVVEPGQAVRIFTGAVLPGGADAVVMVERAREDRESGRVTIDAEPGEVRPGQHVRRRGSDLGSGEAVLAPGRRLRPADLAALASIGCTRVPARRAPRVAVLSTGDEIVPPRFEPAPHQIRNSNGVMLAALLRDAALAPIEIGIVGDEPDELDRALATGLEADLLLVTGGVSVGEYDLVRGALERAGTRVLFHGVAIKPGKPILAGRRGSCIVIGLPGNPVSALAGFALFVEPLLRKLEGQVRPATEALAAVVDEPFRCRPGRRTWHLAWLEWREGVLHGRRVSSTGSGDVLSMSRANGFLVTDERTAEVEAGSRLPAWPWPRAGLRL